MALAYTAPTWTDGSGEGISASNLQAISNCIEGLVQGTDKAVHAVSINGSVITLTFADGTQETGLVSNLKGISSITKTGTSGNVDTYTITYTDGTTDTFTVTNGSGVVYDGTLTIKQNGVDVQEFSANQQTDVDADIITDEWTSTATVSSGSVTFTGLSDDYGYVPYAEDTFCHITGMTKTGSGNNVALVYTTDAADNTVVKLRILK